MQLKDVRTFVFGAVAIGLVGVTAPVPVVGQVFGPTFPDGTPKKPKSSPTPSDPTTTPPPTTAESGDTTICKVLQAKMQELSKSAKKDHSDAKTLQAECANTGIALGLLHSMRVVTEVCTTGDKELDASLVKMFDNFVNMTREILVKQCR